VDQRHNKIKIFTIFFLLAVVITTTAGFLYQEIKSQPEIKQTFLASIFNTKEAYSDIFENLQQQQNKINAKAGIVSHHFLAKQLIADFYSKVGSENIKTVFLVSPDHFNNYFDADTIAYASNLDWTTPFGQINADKNQINLLLESKKVKINNSAVGLDHGIYIEAPFIKKFFPNAKIIPLILKNSSNFENFEALGRQITENGPENSIMIVSSDFSHNLLPAQAKENDKKSIDALNNLNKDTISTITSDCEQCLATLSGFLGGNSSFFLLENKDSFDISNESPDSVTSYMSGYFAKKDNVQIMFVGDLMFDRGIRHYANKNGGNNYIFEKISDSLLQNDLVVANLEGPITDNRSISSGTVPGSANNYIFTFDKSLPRTLFTQNIRLVSLANNHILNFNTAGVKSTKSYLDKENINYFGAPHETDPLFQNIGGLKIAFVSFNQFIENNPEEIEQQIKNAKQNSDLVFVFAHWGNEYETKESGHQQNLGHRFVDAGADFVVGSHPHVIQPSEEYNGKKIYYSLGNFIFDQYFEENVRNGMGVQVSINKETKQLSFKEIKFYLQSNGQTVLK
jgi:poly-gamma-glutamate synthesis protein (capsule biosynthesis protein)